MIALAISILWFALGLIVLLGVVWLLLYGIKLFVPVPAPIEQVIWVIVLILCLIAGLTMLLGGGGGMALQLPHLGR